MYLKQPLPSTPSYVLRSFNYDLIVFVDNLTEKFNALLTFLIAIGIVIDPTTQGISDSEQAMDYESLQ
ncbi:phage holin [Bacillus halotolerans]|nr:phage holin [Bacillus halotolerans]